MVKKMLRVFARYFHFLHSTHTLTSIQRSNKSASHLRIHFLWRPTQHWCAHQREGYIELVRYVGTDVGVLSARIKGVHRAVWTRPEGTNPVTNPSMFMQDDGNFVLRDEEHRAIWSTQTHGSYSDSINIHHPTVEIQVGTLAVGGNTVLENTTDFSVNISDGRFNHVVIPGKFVAVNVPGGPGALAVDISRYDFDLEGGRTSGNAVPVPMITTSRTGRVVSLKSVQGDSEPSDPHDESGNFSYRLSQAENDRALDTTFE